ncbi:D-alanyl-D-alanine carboxypeptidase [Chryseobacterium soldanellicola]|uniref:D-alanyl-D-alanine carboxypeptidase n=1 Tax=Chryseobacterium soldanellicola TaxID=311333 RepID=A0A1H0YU88_9FLAO|nr:M15 family metallopeptidase [Chryseobacterium soldanellicola]SDQ18491.1 D-alanyl-D-alanine carboxypeptidase [Chryseobacterium soldanellicola]
MSKKGISQIKGPAEIRLGETAYYEVSRIYDIDDKKKVDAARWKLYALDFKHHDNWRELTPKAGTPPKIGYRVPVIVTNQSLVGSELMLEAYIYEPEKRIPPGLRIKVLPGLKKRISRVELFKADNSPIKEDTVMKYGQTIKVKVYTENMQGEMVKLSLYEDDAQGGGDSPKNKNNRVAHITKALNKKGFLWHEFKLNIDFTKIANAVMDGSHDKLHEYYVVVETAEHKSVSKNVEVQNPDYIFSQTVSSGVDTEKTYGETLIEEVVIKGKYKKQPGINPHVNTGNQVATVFEPDEKKKDDKCACKQYDLIWGDKIGCNERKKIVEVAKSLNVNPNWLMTIIALETAETFNPSIDNGIGYVGLIQFGSGAAKDIGTDQKKLVKMSFVDQMDYVEKHLTKSKIKYKTLADLYLAVLYPSACGHGSERDYIVLEGTAYKKNPFFFKEDDEWTTKVIKGKIKKVRSPKDNGKTYVWEVALAAQEVYAKGLINKEKRFSCNAGKKMEIPKEGNCVDTWDKSTNGKIEKLHPKIRCAAKNFINEVEKTMGIQLRIIQGYRTYAEQNDLYAQGRTKGGSKVTNAKGGQSNHNFGLAIDVAEIKNGRIDWAEQETVLPKIAPIGKKWGFDWGGDWKSLKDKPHFEMMFGKSLSELRKLYEDNNNDPTKIPL